MAAVSAMKAVVDEETKKREVEADEAADTGAEEQQAKRQKLAHGNKDTADFRNYVDSQRQETVRRHYELMRTRQNYAFVKRMEAKWLPFDKATLTVREAFAELGGYVDSSDPDTELPNFEHNLQTAEAIRAAGHPDWMVLTGLVHDMGKLMFKWGDAADGQEGTAQGDQFALGGDTWVVGCALPDCCVFPQYNKLNKDMADPVMSTKNGVYEPHCGLKNLKFAWGHDEYLYRMLLHNKQCSLPEEGLAMIRYHSCYPLHRHGAYEHFYAEGDAKLIEWVLEFNKFDLYSKADKRPDIDALWPYYQTLIDKYMPGKLQW